jgi:hypothetical protein
MRDDAHTLSDFRVLTLSIECEPCGRFGRYNIAKLIEKYGDRKTAGAPVRAWQYVSNHLTTDIRPAARQLGQRLGQADIARDLIQ